MSKNKETYLPIDWCKKVTSQLPQLFGTDKINATDMCIIASRDSTPDEKKKVLAKYPKFAQLMDSALFFANACQQNASDAYKELLSDIDVMASLISWSHNKQSFKIDADFSNELIRTKNLRLTKNAWDYLPYKIFYIDISDNKKLCETVCGKGFIVRPEKSKDEKVWYLHICKLTDKFFFSDVIVIPNEDDEIGIDKIEQHRNVNLMDVKESKNGYTLETSNREVDTRMFLILVIQILTYLASIEPDIRENEKTKYTYRKPSSTPKNKFSEVQAWDVGIRFGTAYRKWSKQTSASHSAENQSTGTGARKRPHVRHAHWHHFWYGPQNGERVLRPKWIQETFVNASDDTNIPVTIHKTS